jgi:NAD-dependent dihydropyrimidine dehydrogenase PreA subunit
MIQHKYIKNVSTLKLDSNKCNGCRMCTKVCPHAVFVMQDKKAVIAQLDSCMECGACALNCEQGALTVEQGVGCAAAVLGDSLGFLKGCDC